MRYIMSDPVADIKLIRYGVECLPGVDYGCLGDTEGKSHIAAPGKSCTGNYEKVLFSAQILELVVCKPGRSLHEDIKCA